MAQRPSSIVDRMIRAARLDVQLYEEVEHDRSATVQAAIVVAGTSLLAGIGAAGELGIGGLLVITAVGLLGWGAYAYITYLVGTRLLAGPDTRADWSELARALGFANSPRALLILGVVPLLGVVVALLVGLWVLATTVTAIRAALDFTTGRAIGTAVFGWFILVAINAISFALLR